MSPERLEELAEIINGAFLVINESNVAVDVLVLLHEAIVHPHSLHHLPVLFLARTVEVHRRQLLPESKAIPALLV